MDFMSRYKEKVDDFNHQLVKCMAMDEDVFKNKIKESMLYSLECGGKRLRPVLLLESCRAWQSDMTTAIDFAMAIEMIHTYSLIHDDLPAMDDDDLRRGKPTNHKVFGEALAVLAGDALLNRAYELMTEAALKAEQPHRALRAMKVIADAAGINGMITGQVADIETENTVVSKETLDYINLNKTGALFKASLLAGAILGGAGEWELEVLEKCADNIGIAFQIVDDILDITGDEAVIGKPVGSDEKNLKTTYPILIGLEPSKAYVQELTTEALDKIRTLNRDTAFVEEIFNYLVSRKN